MPDDDRPLLGTVVDVLTKTLRKQSNERVGLAAAGAAFWLVIAAFPTVIAVVSTFGLVLTPERVADNLGSLSSAVPGSFGSLMTDQLRHLAASSHSGLTFGLVLSAVLAVWSASAGVFHLDSAVRDAYGLPPQRYLEARVRAVVGAIAVVALLGVGASARPIIEATSSGPLLIIGLPAALVVVVVGVGTLYRFAVGRPVRARAVLPGALASGIGVLVVTSAFGLYVGTTSRYTAVYGAFAGAAVGMLGIYLSVYVVLLGAVLNVELGRSRTHH